MLIPAAIAGPITPCILPSPFQKGQENSLAIESVTEPICLMHRSIKCAVRKLMSFANRIGCACGLGQFNLVADRPRCHLVEMARKRKRSNSRTGTKLR